MKITVTENGQQLLSDLLGSTPVDLTNFQKSFRIQQTQSSNNLKQLIENHKKINCIRNTALIVTLGNAGPLSEIPAKDIDTLKELPTKRSAYLSAGGRTPSDRSSPVVMSRFNTKNKHPAGLKSPKAGPLSKGLPSLFESNQSLVVRPGAVGRFPRSPLKANKSSLTDLGQTPSSVNRLEISESPWRKKSMAKVSTVAFSNKRFRDLVQPLETERSAKNLAWASTNSICTTRHIRPVFNLEKRIENLKHQTDSNDYFKDRTVVIFEQIQELKALMNNNKSMADILRFIIRDQHVFSASERNSIMQKYCPLQIVHFNDYDLVDMIENKEQLQKLLTVKLHKIESDMNRVSLAFNRSKAAARQQGSLAARIGRKVCQRLARDADGRDYVQNSKQTADISDTIKHLLHDYQKTLSLQVEMKKKAWNEKKLMVEEKQRTDSERIHRKKEGCISKSKVLSLTQLLEISRKRK